MTEMILKPLAIWICFVGVAGVLDAQDRLSSDGFRRSAFESPKSIVEHWRVQDSASNVVGLEQLKGCPTIVVLFRGHGCYHCVQQLGELEKVESRFRSRGVRLVAISDEGVDTMKNALESRPLPFEVFTDSKSRLAKSLGSSKIENWHGVVLLDKKANARWLVAGSKPLMDFREVVALIDEMELSSQALESHFLDK